MESSSSNNNSNLKKSNSNKIREIVRLQQILKKWKKIANAHPKINTNAAVTTATAAAPPPPPPTTTISATSSSSNKSINKFLKKTLSFTESSSNNMDINNNNSNAAGGGSGAAAAVPPKGYLSVCVGKELKRFVIPMEYLGHQAFRILLREAEEEFGFQQEGVLKIPCQVPVFEKILRMMEQNKKKSTDDDDDVFFLHQNDTIGGCYSPDNSDQLTPSHHPPQLCR